MTESLKNNGVFKLKDDKTGKELDLEFIDTHQPVRQLDDGHYFACTDFRVVGTKDQIYDIDFWVNDKDGTMSVSRPRCTRFRSSRKASGCRCRATSGRTWQLSRRALTTAMRPQRRRRSDG